MMNSGPIRVLLVDDDEDDYIISRDLFAEIGAEAYSLEWADSYEKALVAIAQNHYDVFLVDYWLGAHNGLDLLRETQARGSRVPMILLTGLGDHGVDMEAMRAGAEDFLVKGQITAKSLERSIRYAIERKRAEREIQKLASFPRSNPNPVLELAADGTLSYSNDAAQKMADSLGTDSLLSILPADVPRIVAQCLLRGETRNLQTTLHNRTVSWSFVPIPTSQTVHCYATEITERLNLEAQLRHSVKMEAVGQLAAGVAHDFNNILTVIQGHAELLLRRPFEGESEKSLKQICQATDRAGNLVRQLLMFSRKQVMQPRCVDLNEVIRNVSRMLQRLLGEHIALELPPAPSLSSVYADVGMLEQVLVNLAINSRDAMSEGGRLILSTGEKEFSSASTILNPEARQGRFVYLKVQDTGCGMDSTTLGHLFEPFFTTKEIGKGTGLGLATVYGIIKQHQGWIVVESKVGLGSTFTIFVPVAEKPAEALSGLTASPEPPVQGGRETILVVEDEHALRELVVNILEIYGYRIFQADTGVTALKIWKEHKNEIHLLLTDMVMPQGVSGRQLAEILQKEKPELKVIYTSGYSPGMAGKDIALLEGFNFLAKPYPPSRLAEMVRECLDMKPGKAIPVQPR